MKGLFQWYRLDDNTSVLDLASGVIFKVAHHAVNGPAVALQYVPMPADERLELMEEIQRRRSGGPVQLYRGARRPPIVSE